jgi:hypothetical protein
LRFNKFNETEKENEERTAENEYDGLGLKLRYATITCFFQERYMNKFKKEVRIHTYIMTHANNLIIVLKVFIFYSIKLNLSSLKFWPK